MSGQTLLEMHPLTQEFPGIPALTAAQQAIFHLWKLLS